eukprot:gene13920-19850_t
MAEEIFAGIPEITKLVALGTLLLVRWSVFPSQPAGGYWAHDQALVTNSVLLMAKKYSRVVLLTQDYDEYFIPLNPSRTVNDVIKRQGCLTVEKSTQVGVHTSNFHSLIVHRMDVAASSLADSPSEIKLWNTTNKDQNCHPLMKSDFGMWTRNFKPIMWPQHTVRWHVHGGLGERAMWMSKECLYIMHVINMWGRRGTSKLNQCMFEDCDPPVMRIDKVLHRSLTMTVGTSDEES